VSDTPSTRPEGLEPHIPYICPQTGRVRMDVLPTTPEQVREVGLRLQEIYGQAQEAT